MKYLPACLAFVAAVICPAQTPELVWETSGFIGPESVVFDASHDVFYVSNMGTHGNGAVPDDGFISRVSAEGKILELKWVTGLDDPKGLALANGRLYVGDEPALAEIDIAAGKIIARHAPADGGKGNFNDCTADAAGNVYVCSGRLNTVFRLSGGKFEPWFKLDTTKTGGLNGLKAEKDRLLLGGWSVRVDGKEQLGHISTVAYAGQALGRLGSEPVCHIDGLEPDGKGGYTVTDWLTGDVKHVSADGKPTQLMQLGRGTADHAYLIDKQLLIIPQMLEHKLRAFRWKP
ncbi:MAG TPA: hypothetical protein VG734_27125 [Lacunisphaera sp.]|nr:hypothetical protein [Lacunisphaera sp.]